MCVCACVCACACECAVQVACVQVVCNECVQAAYVQVACVHAVCKVCLGICCVCVNVRGCGTWVCSYRCTHTHTGHSSVCGAERQPHKRADRWAYLTRRDHTSAYMQA